MCSHEPEMFGWWTHNTVYKWWLIQLYTWTPYDCTNQCHPNKFNKKNKIRTKAATILANMCWMLRVCWGWAKWLTHSRPFNSHDSSPGKLLSFFLAPQLWGVGPESHLPTVVSKWMIKTRPQSTLPVSSRRAMFPFPSPRSSKYNCVYLSDR